jgi:hypothetical protein
MEVGQDPNWGCSAIRKKYTWEGNIKIDLREQGWGGMDWINLAQDRDQ